MACVERSCDEDVCFFFLEGEGEVGSVALRFKEVARDGALRVGEDKTCVEASEVDITAGAGVGEV